MKITTIIEGTFDECMKHQIDFYVPQESPGIGILDELRADYMLLHQKVNKLQKSIPDPVEMWEALENGKNKKKSK